MNRVVTPLDIFHGQMFPKFVSSEKVNEIDQNK